MKEALSLARQNYVITPEATAFTQSPPRNIQEQTWLLILTGVAIVDIKGTSTGQWLHETVSIRPTLQPPLDEAINWYNIPTPAGTEGVDWVKGFHIIRQSSAYFVAPSSMFNAGVSVNSGFAVDSWGRNPYGQGTDILTNMLVGNLFDGITADVAVRDTDAILHRVSYHITLVGRIVFVKVGAPV
jgi:hypothetical protein